jgi:hypothetical protein
VSKLSGCQEGFGSSLYQRTIEAADREWRAAFPFDPKRAAIVLVAADIGGVIEKKFYKRLSDTADARYAQHLETLKAKEKAPSAKQVAAKSAINKGKKR